MELDTEDLTKELLSGRTRPIACIGPTTGFVFRERLGPFKVIKCSNSRRPFVNAVGVRGNVAR